MINFAVIGTGWITDSFVKGAHATDAWRLVAVYSRKEDTGRAFGFKYGVTKIHTSLESLAGDPGVGAVYIASPNSFHHEQAKLILGARKHVILEKPTTSTVAEFEDLCSTAKANGVHLIEAYRHIQEVNFKVLKSNLDRLGPVYGASLNYATYSSRYSNVLNGETPNIFSLEYSGGSLVDIGVYPICMAVALFGKPRSQTYKPVIIATGADGGGVIVLNYDEFAVSINASKCYLSKAPTEFYGQNGTFVLNAVTDIDRVAFLDAKSKKADELAKPKAALNLQEEAAEFARIIGEDDREAAEKLEEISRIIINITTDLREQSGIVFKAER